VPQWRIFYADGPTFDSDQGGPADAPCSGFVAAVGYDEAGDRYIMQSWDHYCYDQGSKQWWGCDLFGVFDRLRMGVMFAYKEGRTVTKETFSEIVTRAHKDPDFPQKG